MKKKLIGIFVATTLGCVSGFASAHAGHHYPVAEDCHPARPMQQRVWLRYETNNPHKPPKLLTSNPGSEAGYTDFAVTINRRVSDGEPLPYGGYVAPWNLTPTKED